MEVYFFGHKLDILGLIWRISDEHLHIFQVCVEPKINFNFSFSPLHPCITARRYITSLETCHKPHHQSIKCPFEAFVSTLLHPLRVSHSFFPPQPQTHAPYTPVAGLLSNCFLSFFSRAQKHHKTILQRR
ncbi:uncharacterized protein YALI1_D28354g [Yarrowia lipolytica]|uniref:Uncharacterized protein n=1 Tax=Yarrowia lipolytica TaxID=4952 RepID=A0A1D8NFR1_YARLL|nr:hypothetical protein YALI1_D28354g [Yarrowia lipolytica]